MGSPTLRRARLNRARRAAHGWPYCEHDGAERMIASAATHTRALQGHPSADPALIRALTRAIESAAAETGPDTALGVCPDCFCITWRDGPVHR